MVNEDSAILLNMEESFLKVLNEEARVEFLSLDDEAKVSYMTEVTVALAVKEMRKEIHRQLKLKK